MANLLLKVMEDNFLSQLILSPTRLGAILDVVMTNNTDLISHTEIRVHPQLSDHSLLVSTLTCGPRTAPSTGPRANIYSTSIPAYNTALGTADQWEAYKVEMSKTDWDLLAAELPLAKKI